MSELLVRFDTAGNRDDGDVVAVLTDDTILLKHAELIAAPQFSGFTGDGLRPRGGLAQFYSDSLNEFRLERVDGATVRRVRLDRTGQPIAEELLPWPAVDEFVGKMLAKREQLAKFKA